MPSVPPSAPPTVTAYPSPTVLVGVGRLGLAVLERVGLTWSELSDAGADTRNLRLIHVRAAGDDADEAWLKDGREFTAAGHEVGDDDFPAYALDFAILRTLGLVRFHGSTYEVAVPVDRGVAHVAASGDGEEREAHRKRWFDWRPLNSDPARAADLLRRRAERESDLDQFVSPLVQRVRRGHAPGLLLACIARWRALMDGRDPSPWAWVEAAPSPSGDVVQIPIGEPGLPRALDGLEQPEELEAELERELGPRPSLAASLHVPNLFVPRPGDLRVELDQSRLLRMPWESTDWTSLDSGGGGQGKFEIIDLRWAWLGMHDGIREDDGAEAKATTADRRLFERLRIELPRLGRTLYRGLLGLFLDLRRERVHEYEIPIDQKPWLRQRDDAIEQSLNLLSEFFFRELPEGDGPVPIPETAEWRAQPSQASPELRRMVFEPPAVEETPARQLARRLHALEAGDPEAAASEALLREVVVSPRGGGSTKVAAEETWEGGFMEFRRAVRAAVGEVLSVRSLEGRRRDMQRSPPRLSVFVIGDLGEPFVRATLRALVTFIHAELLRSYEPLFHAFREGFQRTLSVVPILWSPQPSGAHSGLDAKTLERLDDRRVAAKGGEAGQGGQRLGLFATAATVRRAEEAAIVEALCSFRRMIEEMPRGLRCVPHIYVNSRVTEHAVLGLDEAVRQTHDFLSLQVRSDAASDEWLRALAVGPSGRDFLATFGCYEAEFPGERIREYLALRLTRAVLVKLRGGPTPRDRPPEGVPQSPLAVLGQRKVEELRGATARRGAELADATRALLGAPGSCSARELEARFGPAWFAEQQRAVDQEIERAIQTDGTLDRGIESIRDESTRHGSADAARLRRENDGRVMGLGRDRVLADLEIELERDAEATRGSVTRAQRALAEAEARVHGSRIPRAHERLRSASEAVATAARRVPELPALVLGGVFAAILGAGTLSPILVTLAAMSGLVDSELGEALFGRGAAFLGGVAAVTVFAVVTRGFLARRRRRVAEAVEGAAQVVRDLIAGDAESVRAFLLSRVDLGVALAERRYARLMDVAASGDLALARRLVTLVDIRELELRRCTERLGVRPDRDARLDPRRDDVSGLLGGPRGEVLADAEAVLRHYRSVVGRDEDASPLVSDVLEGAGGFARWRTDACLQDRAALLSFGRACFDDVRTASVAGLSSFAAGAVGRFNEFVRRHYSTVSTGLGQTGTEGLDGQQVRVLAQAMLVYPGAMRGLVKALSEDGAIVTPSLERREVQVRPNACYLLSVVQGIAAEAARPFGRYESFFERQRFAGGSFVRRGRDAPIHVLTGHEDLAADVRKALQPPRAPESKLEQDQPLFATAAGESSRRDPGPGSSGTGGEG